MSADAPSPLRMVPASRRERWELIAEVTGQWFRLLEAGHPLPLPSGSSRPSPPPATSAALCEWYEIVRLRPDVWCIQDGLFVEPFFTRSDEFLIIGVECQACAFWGVRRSMLSHDDPPVFISARADGSWIQENAAVSEFAVAWLVSSVKSSKDVRCWAQGPANVAVRSLIADHYPRLGLPDWHWPAAPTRFYGERDLVAEVQGDDDDAWLFVTTRTKAAFDRCCRLLEPARMEWDATSQEWPPGWVSSDHDLA